MSLGECLSFFTSADILPPVNGFECTLQFSASNMYPTASTCTCTLTLPTKYDHYADFKEKVLYGFINHGGFGLC